MKARKLVVKRHQSSTFVSRVRNSGAISWTQWMPTCRGCVHPTTWMRVSYAVTARTSALYVATASVDSQVTSAELVANHVISLKGICREKITNLKSESAEWICRRGPPWRVATRHLPILSGSSLFPSLRRWMSLVWVMRKLKNLACLCSEPDSLTHPRRKTPRPGPGRGT